MLLHPTVFTADTGWLLSSATPGSLGRQDIGPGLLPMILFALLVLAETGSVPFVCSYLSGKSSLSSICRNEVYLSHVSLDLQSKWQMGWDSGRGCGERRLHSYGEKDEKEGGRRYLHAISLMRTLSIRPSFRKRRKEVQLLAP